MKKLLALLLVLLVLSGCGGGEETLPTEETTEPVPTGLYDPESAMEAKTNGAVRAYPLTEELYQNAVLSNMTLIPMGNKLLLHDGNGTLTVLSGDQLEVTFTLKLQENCQLHGEATAQGAFYYQQDTRQVVLLNPQLQEIDRIQLPEDMESYQISPRDHTIYYSVPGQIRALDMETGISRLIRSHSYTSALVLGAYFDGELLWCSFADAQNQSRTEYISSETGQTQYTEFLELWTYENTYYVHRYDSSVEQQIAGTRNGEAKLLTIQEENKVNAMIMGGILGYELDAEGMELSLYDVRSGKRTSFVTLDGIQETVARAVSEQYVWILTENKDTNQKPTIYRWDVKATPVRENVVYTDTLYTAENPDTEGLAACQERVDGMNKQYGVRIRIWENAAENAGELVLTPEYQVQSINQMLDSLEPVLAMFPEGFLQKTVKSGWIYIDLVRQIGGKAGGNELQWTDGDCHIILAGTWVNDNCQAGDDFLKLVGYAIDSHVLGNSRDYDEWSKLNPEGFAYTQDPAVIEEYAQTYLEEGSGFITEQSFYSPSDERACMFYYAMHATDNLLANEARQLKLKLLCEGIREAYRLEKKDEAYPWEQYLTLELDFNNIR